MSLPLFDRYAVDDITAGRHRGSPESEEAHERLRPSKAYLQAAVLDSLRRRGLYGATTEEIASELGLRVNSVSGRMTELRVAGLAVKTDRHRLTLSGCQAAVIVATGFGE